MEIKCVCGNVATEPMTCYVKGVHIRICKSCKWMIAHDQHDEPTDGIKEILWEPYPVYYAPTPEKGK